MKFLTEEQLATLTSGQIIYFEEYTHHNDSGSSYKKWGEVTRVEKNVQGVGYWVILTLAGDFQGNVFNHEHHRYSRWNRFYLPDNPEITNRLLQRQMASIIDKFTNADIGQHVLGNKQWF